jgi:hypothetical protein
MTLETRKPQPPQPGIGHESVAQAALEASRQRVEEGLGALRQAIDESPVGRFAGTWTLPLLAAAVGLSLALLLRRRARDNRELEEDDW